MTECCKSIWYAHVYRWIKNIRRKTRMKRAKWSRYSEKVSSPSPDIKFRVLAAQIQTVRKTERETARDKGTSQKRGNHRVTTSIDKFVFLFLRPATQQHWNCKQYKNWTLRTDSAISFSILAAAIVPSCLYLQNRILLNVKIFRSAAIFCFLVRCAFSLRIQFWLWQLFIVFK